MPGQLRLHATSIAVGANGALIIGRSGAGKSELALQLMAFGAQLISDDQTDLTMKAGALWASAPPTINGLIEARGIGLLHATPTVGQIVLAIDLDQVETERLPHRHEVKFLDVTLPCLHKIETRAWPAAILQYLVAGRREPQ